MTSTCTYSSAPSVHNTIALLSTLLLPLALLAETNNSPIPLPVRTIYTNSTSPEVIDTSRRPGSPTFGSGGGTAESPSASTSFIAVTGDPSTYFFSTPDTMGTVGDSYLLTMLNNAVRIQSRTGESIFYTNSLGGFWTHPSIAADNLGSFALIADPVVIYDPFNNRWIATCMIDYGETNNSSILIAASVTSQPHPTNGWHSLRVKADTNATLWIDQPFVAFNKKWIVVQGNMFASGSTDLAASYFYVFNKTNFYAGGTNVIRLVHTNAEAAGNERPVISYDNTSESMYLIQNADGNFNGIGGRLRLFSITGEVDAPVLNNLETTNAIYVAVVNSPQETVTWANSPPGALNPQIGTETLIASPKDARFHSAVFRNGSIWCAHTVFLPATNVTRNSIQWWQIDPVYRVVRQRGRIDDPAGVNYYAFPSLAVNRFNDVLVGYSSFSANQHPSAAYSYRPFFLENNALLSPYVFYEGQTNYSVSWGDYSASAIDPLNDTDLWTIQQYAEDINGNLGDSWGTAWAQLGIQTLSNDQFSASYALTGSSGNTNASNLRATVEELEPNHTGGSNAASVWFNWTPTTNCLAYISVTPTSHYGRQFDGYLAVYSGSDLTNLTAITNHNGGVATSAVILEVDTNTTYQIAVGGLYNTMGDFNLNWLEVNSMMPAFLIHPQSTNVVSGESVTLLSEAFAEPLPTYQWLSNGVAVADATNATYAISDAQATDDTNQFFYSNIASNSHGSVTSLVALLVVHDSAAAKVTNMAYTAEGSFSIHVHGVTNRPYIVESCTNLTEGNWVSMMTNYVSFNYTNDVAADDDARFYRIYAESIEE